MAGDALAVISWEICWPESCPGGSSGECSSSKVSEAGEGYGCCYSPGCYTLMAPKTCRWYSLDQGQPTCTNSCVTPGKCYDLDFGPDKDIYCCGSDEQCRSYSGQVGCTDTGWHCKFSWEVCSDKTYSGCSGDTLTTCQGKCSGGGCIEDTSNCSSENCNDSNKCEWGYYYDYKCSGGSCPIDSITCTEACCDDYHGDTNAYCDANDFCRAPPAEVCGNGTCAGTETYSNCPEDCCDADCTATSDSTCHSACHTYNGCDHTVGCDGISSGSTICDATGEYEATCCETSFSDCGTEGSQCCDSNCGYQSVDYGCSDGSCWDDPVLGACTDCGSYTCSAGSCTTVCSEACGAACDEGTDCPSGICQSDCTCEPEGDECTSGVCCDTSSHPYQYRPSTYVCDNPYQTDYSCYQGTACDDDVWVRHNTRSCPGNGENCTGDISGWSGYTVYDDCVSTETCAEDDSSCNYNAACEGVPPGFDFSVSLDSTSGSVSQGDSVLIEATVTKTSGDPEVVYLGVGENDEQTGIPFSNVGITFSFTPDNNCTPDDSCSRTLTISTSDSTDPATYSMLISGVDGGASDSEVYTLTVIEAGEEINPPIVETVGYDSLTQTSVILKGRLNSCGGAGTCLVWFEWGTDPVNYGNSTPVQTMNSTGPFTDGISGLDPDTTYYFKAQAKNGGSW